MSTYATRRENKHRSFLVDIIAVGELPVNLIVTIMFFLHRLRSLAGSSTLQILAAGLGFCTHIPFHSYTKFAISWVLMLREVADRWARVRYQA